MIVCVCVCVCVSVRWGVRVHPLTGLCRVCLCTPLAAKACVHVCVCVCVFVCNTGLRASPPRLYHTWNRPSHSLNSQRTRRAGRQHCVTWAQHSCRYVCVCVYVCVCPQASVCTKGHRRSHKPGGRSAHQRARWTNMAQRVCVCVCLCVCVCTG